ncbi:MAG: prolipoprotein diacylglyceryl transferase [Candidatus Omnitrophica bacterium]|nr:prolipoprotein diacylglyceryl transferase [Candidatus Omnitrophota bacterium]
MHPILLKIGPFTLYSYGLMVAVGFAFAAAIIYIRAPKFGIDRNTMIDYIILLLVAGILGARLLYVLLNFRYYVTNPVEILNLSGGGLIWYGGFIIALAASAWFARSRKVEFWNASDLVAPCIALGQAFGRIGCYLNGCCYGAPAPNWFPFGDRYPTQIFSSITLFVIFIILLLWQERRRFQGEIFLGYCLLYSFKRFLIEFLRGDNPKIFSGLTMSQLISIAVFITALFIFMIRFNQWKRKKSSGSK